MSPPGIEPATPCFHARRSNHSAIFAQNFAILPLKREMPHFQEVYQGFFFLNVWHIIETNHSSCLLYSETPHDIT